MIFWRLTQKRRRRSLRALVLLLLSCEPRLLRRSRRTAVAAKRSAFASTAREEERRGRVLIWRIWKRRQNLWSKVAKRYGPFQRPKVGIYTTTKKPFRCARKVVVGGGVESQHLPQFLDRPVLEDACVQRLEYSRVKLQTPNFKLQTFFKKKREHKRKKKKGYLGSHKVLFLFLFF